jgi:hypothetical protein
MIQVLTILFYIYSLIVGYQHLKSVCVCMCVCVCVCVCLYVHALEVGLGPPKAACTSEETIHSRSFQVTYPKFKIAYISVIE